MANIKKDLTGLKFGRLTVLKQADDYVSPSGNKMLQWLCECECGNKIVVTGSNLKKKVGTKSCGCLSKENSYNRLKKYNIYDLSGEYGIGYTSKKEKFYFDLEDYEKIKNYCWLKNAKGYFYSYYKNSDGKPTTIKLHRLIMNCNNTNLDIDHIHGKQSRYDNRKSNLRIATKSQNNMNKGLRSHNTSGVTGVCWVVRDSKWNARITINKKRINLGYFDCFDDAVKARKEAEEKYFGKYSYDNSMSSY